MKVTINTTEPQKRDVDWSKPMVVVSETGTYIITTGVYNEYDFEGINTRTGTVGYWLKSAYTPCTTPVTITFENEL